MPKKVNLTLEEQLIEDVAAHGALYLERPLQGPFGICVHLENGRAIILIEKSLGEKDRIWTIAHEIGHLLYDRLTPVTDDERTNRKEAQLNESMADRHAFAF